MKDHNITITIPAELIEEHIEYAKADGKKLTYKEVCAAYETFFEEVVWQDFESEREDFVRDVLVHDE